MRPLLHPASTTPALKDVALLISRVALGVVLLAHGLQKLNEFTLEGTTAAFGQMGVPAAGVAAVVVTVVEIIGGAALVLGLLTPVVALINVITLTGALVIVHAENGIFVQDNGFELVLALAAGLLVVAALGAGRFSVDALIRRPAPATVSG
ncbi:DoxX family protein [Janibacter cremeus]|uniref:DoxX family protein n=1 Tax=Janibacter cremeus TaxID=1285192 RepID=UPI0023F7EC1B|nr:DoxX family protein [Janibacter cremeus]WEV77609.1 DoxX family protein [Janibacter cremeus]